MWFVASILSPCVGIFSSICFLLKCAGWHFLKWIQQADFVGMCLGPYCSLWRRYFYTYLYRLLYENPGGIPYISLPWMLTCCEGLLAPQNLIHNRLLLSWRSLFTWDDTVGISQNVNSSVWLLSVTRLSHFIRSPDLESEWSRNIQRNLAWQWQWLTIVFN